MITVSATVFGLEKLRVLTLLTSEVATRSVSIDRISWKFPNVLSDDTSMTIESPALSSVPSIEATSC